MHYLWFALKPSLKDVILEISSKRLGCTAVVDENSKLLGIITDGDLRRMLQKDININSSYCRRYYV